MMAKTTAEFNALLRDCRVQAGYDDVSGRRRRASLDALLALLRALGVEIRDPSQAAQLLLDRQHQRRLRGVEPVHVAWNGSPRPAVITLPSALAGGSLGFRLNVGAECIEGVHKLDDLPMSADPDGGSSDFVTRRLPLPKKLPWGYHKLEIDAGGRTFHSLILAAPRQALDRNGTQDVTQSHHQTNGEATKRRPWGCFLPLYALRTERDWGVGDFPALGELMEWVGRLGGSDVGTLPLLAAFLDEPLEVSPYRPASRLFWNELYIDIEAIPELQDSPECRQWVASDGFRQRVEAQRNSELVDYREVMKLKREVLERLAGNFFAERPARFGDLQKFVAETPGVEDYARFRAACERQRASWPSWPDRMRQGRLDSSDYDEAAANYHLYAQWIAVEQLTAVREKGEAAGCRLYLDLPIGVDPCGYDVWRHQSLYAAGASVGAPPDMIFPKGQDWGLPPLHPQRIREAGYDLFRRVMETNCRFAGRLRIDHVLGFHRLYCIPPGFGADAGAYIRYQADELYAVAILESHRNGCALVGENLGTVPASVDRQIGEHGIAGMWVAPYELEPGRRSGLSPPPPQHVAMLNTHDMPPLAAWWSCADIEDRVELGLISAEAANREREQRRLAIEQLKEWLRSVGVFTMESEEGDAERVPLLPLVRGIAVSPARLVLINLEDLWLETRPQNIPGISEGRPNWRRRARYRLDELEKLPDVLKALQEADAFRKAKEQPV